MLTFVVDSGRRIAVLALLAVVSAAFWVSPGVWIDTVTMDTG